MSAGRALEEYVKRVYELLLNLRDEGIKVERNKKLPGRSKTVWEFDLYYEFINAGITHRVAIECKDHGRAVDQGRIAEFAFKLQDVGGLSGVLVSSRGVQSGGEVVAASYGIKIQTTSELPPIPTLFAQRLSAVALPDESYWGEPFWVVMEHQNGTVTGSLFASIEQGRKFLPLFLSRYHAQLAFDAKHIDAGKWCIRGLPRYALRAFILMMKLFESEGVEPVIVFRPPGDLGEPGYVGLVTNAKLLAQEYYCASVPGVYDV